MTLLKVSTKSNQIPTRRRAGFEFSTTPKTVDADAAQEKLLREDDALIVTNVSGDGTDAGTELGNESAAHSETKRQLERAIAVRDAALAKLAEHNIELGELQTELDAGAHDTGGQPRTVTDDEFGGPDSSLVDPNRHRSARKGKRE